MTFPAQLPIPEEVLAIARTLVEAGFDTWCVGGAVRDNLLGQENQDFDLATAARPEDIQRLFKRTIPVGIEHGTVAVLDRRRQPHEVTTFRKDVATDGRHAVVQFGVSLLDDLARRDFTINAIAYHPLTHEWRDPFDGAADLEAKLLRAVGDAATRFREDYLRILRLLRFAARFGFTIEPATWEAARANVAGLETLSAERVRDEWLKGLTTAIAPSRSIQLWHDVGAVGIWMPDFGDRESGIGSRTPHVLDRITPTDPVLITAYLSADPAGTLRRLRCSNADIARAERFAAHRGAVPNPEVPVEVRRWLARVGEAADDLIQVALAEGQGARLAAAVQAVRASGAPLSLGHLAVDGNDLIAAGVPKGPAIGDTLRMLLEKVLEDPALNERNRLLDLMKSGTIPDSRFPIPGSSIPDSRFPIPDAREKDRK